MQITEITIEYGTTHALGNYSNIKPVVSLTAMLDPDDDPDEVLAELLDRARNEVHGLVDDALELNGNQPVYYQGTLFRVYRNDARRCLILVDADQPLPEEVNWKHRDNWSKIMNRGFSGLMRLNMARATLDRAQRQHPDFTALMWFGDPDELPSLPDPGPEPAWHRKSLSHMFSTLGLAEEIWEELAELEHVTVEWLQLLRRNTDYDTPTEEYERLIRAGELPRPNPIPEWVAYDDDEDDYDDDTF